MWLLMSGTGRAGFTGATIVEIVVQIFLPFVAGQLSRRWIGGFVTAHPELKLVDRGSIVLVVYGAFSAGMREHMWSQTSWTAIGILLILSLVILAIMLSLTWEVARRLGFSREDAIRCV